MLNIASDLAALFENSECSRQVTYTDETGFQKQVWVIARFGDSMDPQLTSAVGTFRMRKSDVTEPKARETFTLDDGSDWEVVHVLSEDSYTVRVQVQCVRRMKIG